MDGFALWRTEQSHLVRDEHDPNQGSSMIFRARGGLWEVSPGPEGIAVLCVDATEFDADAVALDALARFALLARRCGYRIVLRHAPAELVDLIELAGLSQALPIESIRPDSTSPRY